MKSFIWIFAILITAAAGYYQRVTGPTKPLKTEVSNGIQRFPVVFQRTHGGTTDCPVVLQISDITVKGFLLYRKYPSKDEMTKIELKREGDKLTAFLPNQPPAGKLEYRLALEKDGNPIIIDNGASVIIRFKGDVPPVVLIIHIILMFLGMLFSNVTGIYALFKIRSYKCMTVLTFAILAVGGLVLGPIVLKYAFNEWRDGVPFGCALLLDATYPVSNHWGFKGMAMMNTNPVDRNWLGTKLETRMQAFYPVIEEADREFLSMRANSWMWNALLAGPVYTINFDRVYWDFQVLGGMNVAYLPQQKLLYEKPANNWFYLDRNTSTINVSYGLMAGTALRFPVTERINLRVGIDYYRSTAKVQYEQIRVSKQETTILTEKLGNGSANIPIEMMSVSY